MLEKLESLPFADLVALLNFFEDELDTAYDKKPKQEPAIADLLEKYNNVRQAINNKYDKLTGSQSTTAPVVFLDM